ncbi:hypothetical protein Lser_V15G40429 [Lactuca serriola]
MDKTIHVIRVGRDNCRGTHLNKDCDHEENDWRKPEKKWLHYDEYNKLKEDKYEQKGRGFYQKEGAALEKKIDFEAMLAYFAATSEKRHDDTDAVLINQQASIKNIKQQIGQLAKQFNERLSGTLPNNIEQNPRGAHIKSVTRSGKFFIRLTPVANDKSDVMQAEQETSQEKATDQSQQRGKDTTTWQSSEDKNKEPVKPYHPLLQFPSQAKQDKQVEDYQKFLEHIKSLQINISFIEAVAQMSKYAKFLKDLLTNRKKMEEASKVVLNETCSAAMLNLLPNKMGDPRSLTLPCQFGNLATSYALADSGTKMEEDNQAPIILGRPFFSTAQALVDIIESKLTVRVGEDDITFRIDRAMQHSRISDDITFAE